ncbi:hypothetical protein L228DRAFT_248082 [Xylona heveae TC161]|uniref:Uncharacterized protein n=1 Tax=Xylona heveae (strain CBS 132557 / TC161) TaxID=1328760 RepID=A0A165GNL2_XYLHT|nr:hypothetical protein L228DRAFT_248082 [Xylona heveae TC161]KZF22407.1 hypothetical protein L228DRAFT_248082 [Xylona heveae TC161]
MASKKDMRRVDLVIPYISPEKEKSEGDISSTMSTTLPMAAMFTRNKMVGWVSVVFSLQHWLSETPGQKNSSAPGYFAVLMALLAVVVTYLPLFLPPPPNSAGTGTEAPAAVPPA